MTNLDHLNDCVEIGEYMKIKASEVLEGDLLRMNYAGDATVTLVEVSTHQTVLTYRHADGDESSGSWKPADILEIRPRK